MHIQLIPLLLVNNHEHGGYDMDDSEIGIILMVAAIMQLLLQVRSMCVYSHVCIQSCVYTVMCVCINYVRTYVHIII